MESWENKEFVVYGISKFSKKKFKEIKNRKFFNKPRGGLWASPLVSSRSWREWCLDEDFNVSEINKFCKFKLKKESRIYTINTDIDLTHCPRIIRKELIPGYIKGYIDFEGLKKEGYDGIYLTAFGVCQTASFVYLGEMNMDLYGWDVESLLLFNYDCIVPVKEKRIRINKKDHKKNIIILSTQKNSVIDGVHRDNLIWKEESERIPSTWIIKGSNFKSKKSFIKEARRLQRLISDDPEGKFMIK